MKILDKILYPKVNVIEEYYRLSKLEFGTNDEYNSSKAEIDFICMLRDKFEKSIDFDCNEIQVGGRVCKIIDLETYLEDKSERIENDLKYSGFALTLSLITISSNSLLNIFSKGNDIEHNLLGGLYMIISLFGVIQFVDVYEERRNKKNNSLKSFYKLSHNILQQVTCKKTRT